MATVTRYEVQRQARSGSWGPLFGEGPVRFDTRKAAEAERRRVGEDWAPLRIVRVDDVLRITQRDLDAFAAPLAARFWPLHRPGDPRVGGHNGPLEALAPLLDVKRSQVGANWASLSGWAPCPIDFAPEVELPGLWRRFPFARPRTVEGVVRLLTLHELAHYARSHNGLLTSLDHEGTREELRAKFATMDREADELARVWWREGLTRENVPVRKDEQAVAPRRTRRAA